MNTTIGFAYGNLSYDVPAGGGAGQVAYSTLALDSTHSEVYKSNGVGSWSTGSSWSEAGLLEAVAMGSVNQGEGANWNCTGLFRYGDGDYKLYAANRDYAAAESNLVVYGLGSYGGDWYQW